MIFKTTYPSSVIRSAVLVVTHALSSLKPVIGCESEMGRDLTESYDKVPKPTENSYKVKSQHKSPTNSLYTHRLWADFGWSAVKVTTITQLVGLNGLIGQTFLIPATVVQSKIHK